MLRILLLTLSNSVTISSRIPWLMLPIHFISTVCRCASSETLSLPGPQGSAAHADGQPKEGR